MYLLLASCINVLDFANHVYTHRSIDICLGSLPIVRRTLFCKRYDSKREVSAANSQAGHAYVDLMSALYHCLGCCFRQQTRHKTPDRKPSGISTMVCEKKNQTKYHAVVANKIIYRLISDYTYVYIKIMYYR